MSTEGVKARRAPSGRGPLLPQAAVTAASSRFRGAQKEAVTLLAGQDRPLTTGQIARLMGLTAQEAQSLVTELCEQRLARRLNTIIPSFIAAPGVKP